MMYRVALALALLAGLTAPSLAQRAAPAEIRSNGDIWLGNAAKLGKREGSKTVLQPDTVEVPTLPAGSYWSDDPVPATFTRIGNRLLVGDAVSYTGQKFGGNSPGGIYATWLQREAVLYASHPTGAISIVGATRSGLQTKDYGRAPIGITGLLNHDNTLTTSPAWAGYLDTVRKQGTTTTFGLEIAAKNQGTDGSVGAPYGPLFGLNATNGIWLAGGGDPAFGGVPTGTSQAAITIGKNGSTWDKGIIFDADGLTGNDGVTAGQISTAVEMGMGQRLVWRNADDTQRNAIWAEVDPVGGGGRFGLKFGLLKGEMMGNGNVPVARFISTFIPKNLPVFVSADTGGAPQLHWTGADTNITGLYATQGTGSHLFRTGGVLSNDRLSTGTTSQVEIKHTAGATDYLTLTGGTGGTTVIGVDGATANGNVLIRGKGTGGVILRDGGGSTRFALNTTGVGFNGSAAVGKCTLAAALPTDGSATNAAIATALNTQRTCLINYGLAQ